MGNRNGSRKLIARFRLRNEERVSRYWSEQEKECILCRMKEDSLKYLNRDCLKELLSDRGITQVLAEDEREVQYLKLILKERKKTEYVTNRLVNRYGV